VPTLPSAEKSSAEITCQMPKLPGAEITVPKLNVLGDQVSDIGPLRLLFVL